MKTIKYNCIDYLKMEILAEKIYAAGKYIRKFNEQVNIDCNGDIFKINHVKVVKKRHFYLIICEHYRPMVFERDGLKIRIEKL